MRIGRRVTKIPHIAILRKKIKKMILKIPNQDQRCGLAEYDIKWFLTIIEKPEQKLSSITVLKIFITILMDGLKIILNIQSATYKFYV